MMFVDGTGVLHRLTQDELPHAKSLYEGGTTSRKLLVIP